MKLDFTPKLPKGYLSWSALNSYLTDPKEYYLHYYLGKDFMVDLKKTDMARWEKIRLGKIFQEAWADPRINWRRKLKKDGFTPDKERIIETALKDKNLIRMPIKNCEQRIFADFNGIKLQAIPDGFKDKLLVENKFGAVRDQEMVDDDGQLSFYSLTIKLNNKFIPKIILQSVNDRTGKVNIIKTKRTNQDLKHIGELIIMAARGISLGIWENE
jgi:hypothetical protein